MLEHCLNVGDSLFPISCLVFVVLPVLSDSITSSCLVGEMNQGLALTSYFLGFRNLSPSKSGTKSSFTKQENLTWAFPTLLVLKDPRASCWGQMAGGNRHAWARGGVQGSRTVLPLQYERTQTVLSELKAKYELAEQQNQSLTEELKQCKENLKLLQEKGNNVSLYKICGEVRLWRGQFCWLREYESVK